MKTKFLRLVILSILLLSSFVPVTQAHASTGQKKPMQGLSPAAILNPDGTLDLNKGFNGALDLSEWQVNLDPQRGPVLHSASAAAWQGLGNGTNGNITTIVIDSNNGYAYIGGGFSAICGNSACNSGNITLYNLAVWNGTNWQGLGGYGVNGGIYTIALSGSNVYIGGIFSKICSDSLCSAGTNARNIAYWNGNTWSGFGYGLDSFVFAIAANGNTVYAGGNFNNICGNSSCNSGNVTANYVAKWDGVQWSSIGYGVTSAVYALALNGTDLYLGGYFTHLCGNTACSFTTTSVNYIVKWSTAASTWYSIGNGLNDGVRAIALGANNAIYVGGFFTQTCGNQTCNSGNIMVNRIAQWNGSAWSALGSGVNGNVYAVAVNGSNVYVGGDLTQICGDAACTSGNTSANRIAVWNGSAWSMPANGVDNAVHALAATGATVYAGGTFTQACGNAACDNGNTPANYVAKLSLPMTTTIYATGAQDGWVLESSETSNVGGSLNSSALTFNLGDDATKKQYRGILSFSTGSVPDTAVITGVTLKVKQQAIVGGGNPVTVFQGFLADVKNGMFGTSALQASDFQAIASKTYGPFKPVPVGGWYSLNLTNASAYINKLSANSGLTQIRLRFKLDDNNNAIANYLSLYSGNPSTGSGQAAAAANRPQLVLTYYLP